MSPRLRGWYQETNCPLPRALVLTRPLRDAGCNDWVAGFAGRSPPCSGQLNISRGFRVVPLQALLRSSRRIVLSQQQRARISGTGLSCGAANPPRGKAAGGDARPPFVCGASAEPASPGTARRWRQAAPPAKPLPGA